MAEVNLKVEDGFVNLAVSESTAQKDLFIIDCDAGNDDAMAILYALSPNLDKNVQILGITCVGGNTTLDNVVRNVLRTLKIANREDIPVFKGAVAGLVPRDQIRPSVIHGTDGLGGVAHTLPISDAEVEAVLKRENAVDWLGRTILRYPPGSITLVTLGPLTNVAFAHRLFPDFHAKLKRLVVMGGTLDARGNLGLTCEFNFGCDPEAAHAVLEEFTCPITLIPFDILSQGLEVRLGDLDRSLTRIVMPGEDWYERTLSKVNSRKANFVRAISQGKVDYIKRVYKGQGGWYACDWLAMVCAFNPSGVVLESVQHYGTVEIQGRLTRGQFVIDWKDSLFDVQGAGEKRKLEMVTKMYLAKLHALFEETVK